jgi:hypothetical protein
MDDIKRIRQLIERIETKDFVINEQTLGFGEDDGPGIYGGIGNLLDAVGNILNMGADAFGGLTELVKDLTGDGIPWLVNKFDNTPILKKSPANGDIFEVTKKTAKVLKTLSTSSAMTDSVVYNALVLIVNFVDGYNSNSLTSSKMSELPFWKAMEIFTIGVGRILSGGEEYDIDVWYDALEGNKALVYSNAASVFIETGFTSSTYTITSEAKNGLMALTALFTSGDSDNWGTDRLEDEDGWSDGVSRVYIALNSLNISAVEEMEKMNEFQKEFVEKFDCGGSIIKKMRTYYNEERKIWFGVIDEKGYKILIKKDESGNFFGSIQHNGEKIAIIHHFDCSGKNSYAQETEKVNLDEQEDDDTVYYYQPIVGTNFTMVMTKDEYEKIKGHDQYAGDSEEQPEEEPTPDTTVDDTTPAPETTVDDTEKDVEPTPEEEPKSNIEKLIEVLIQNGYNEMAAQSASARAVEGSVAVSNYLGRIVTQKEYELKEEDYFAEIFMKSILEGKTKFRKGTDMSSHDKKAKEEERIIKMTVDIEQPTEIEKKKIEELGSDADALDRKNNLLFDKKRIKSIRLTSDNSTVIYIANEDISDIVSDIERSIEKTFGGDWYLDKGGNKYLSKNKIFIFKKKN